VEGVKIMEHINEEARSKRKPFLVVEDPLHHASEEHLDEVPMHILLGFFPSLFTKKDIMGKFIESSGGIKYKKAVWNGDNNDKATFPLWSGKRG
jgi:hypothetical protein